MMATQLIREGLSLNKALRLMGLSKSSYFYRSKKASEEEKLAKRLRELALQNPAYGYRRLWSLFKQEGFKVSLKKLYTVYRKLDLSLSPRKKRGYRRTQTPKDVFPIEPAERPSERWNIDFKEKRLADGTRVRILDEFCIGPERFRWYYNYRRPHSSLGYRCPGEIWDERYTHRKDGSESHSAR